MDEEQILKLLIEGGPNAVAAFSEYVGYLYFHTIVDSITFLLAVGVFLAVFAWGWNKLEKKIYNSNQKIRVG